MKGKESGKVEEKSITLEDLKKKMVEFARETDWDQFHSPKNLLLALVGEVGELSEIFQWKGEVPKELPDWSKEEKEHLVDLSKAALRKLELNALKYLMEQCRGSSKKDNQYRNNPKVSDESLSIENSNGNGNFNGEFSQPPS